MKQILLLSALLLVFSSCVPPRQTVPSDLQKSIVSVVPSSAPFSAAPGKDGSAPEASSAVPALEQAERWLSLEDERVADAYQTYLERAENAVSFIEQGCFLYVTDPAGNPVANLMAYWADAGISYSMPCGLIPIPIKSGWEANAGLSRNSAGNFEVEITLADPNTDTSVSFTTCQVELDLEQSAAYHVVWEGAHPNETARTQPNSVAITLQYEDGTPATGLFAHISRQIPVRFLDPDEETNPAAYWGQGRESSLYSLLTQPVPEGKWDLIPLIGGYVYENGQVPNVMIDGPDPQLERGRYTDGDGTIYIAFSSPPEDPRIYYSLQVYDTQVRTLGGPLWKLSAPILDENGQLQKELTLVLLTGEKG